MAQHRAALRRALSKLKYYRDFYWGLSSRYPFYSAPAVFPPHVELELTNNCNLSCPHCHRTGGASMQRPIGNMDVGVVEKLADEISRHPQTMLRLVGQGEPSLHPKFFEIVRLFRDRGIKVHVTSNGSFLSRMPAREILDLGFFEIAVSIDGSDAESFSERRGGGNYGALRQQIEGLHATRARLATRSPIIRIRRTVFPSDSALSIHEFWKQWQSTVDDVSFHTVVTSSKNGALVPYAKCAHILYQASIRWTGDVLLCGHQCVWGDGDEALGNLRDHSLRELWRHRRLGEVRACHAAGNLDSVDFCKYCKHTHLLQDAHRGLRTLVDVMKRQS